MERIFLGLLNIGINVALLVLVGLVVAWILGWLGLAIPENIKKVYLVIVALIALYQVAALVFGLPTYGVIR